MKRNSVIRAFVGGLFCLLSVSCANDLRFEMPQGPVGPVGPKGDSGLSAYEVWMDYINDGNDPEWDGGTTMADFFLYLKGDPGEGAGDLADLITINDETNTWIINGDDTGVPVRGQDGEDGEDGEDGLNGLNGLNGQSAYDYWVSLINAGNPPLDPKTGEPWTGGTTESDFWMFLAGKPGMDSYEEWVIKVNDSTNPVENPHKPGTNWYPNADNGNGDDDGDSWASYWYFFTGGDGLSAYQIWKIEVGKGLDHPKTPGADWPKTQTELEDFWRYLRGADGKDGGAFVIEKGIYNVIVQYQNEINDEFVSPEDGSVVYLVYDNDWDGAEGTTPNLVPNAYVKSIPGLPEDTVIRADENGRLVITKDILPQGKADEDRFGSCLVSKNGIEYDESASNTYVPEKVDIRFRLRGTTANSVRLLSGVVRVDVVVERRTELNGAWERIPAHLSGGRSLNQPTKHYFVADSTSYTIAENATGWGSYGIGNNISSASAYFDLGRPRVFSPYLKDAWVDIDTNGRREDWNGSSPQYMVTRLESYYGEKAQLMRVDNLGEENEVAKPVIFRRVPIQYLPIIKNVTMTEKMHSDLYNIDYYSNTKGEIDKSSVKSGYFFKTNLHQTDQTASVLVTPELMPADEVNAKKLLRIHFVKQLNGTNNAVETSVENAVTLASPTPTWELTGSNYDGAIVRVSTTDANMFSGVWAPNADGNMTLSGTTFQLGTTNFNASIIDGTEDNIHSVPDIEVTFVQ